MTPTTRHRSRRRQRYGLRRRSEPGAAPGTLVPDPQAAAPRMRLVHVGAERYDDHRAPSLADVDAPVPSDAVRWLDVDGLGDADVIRRVGERHRLHPLALEDVLNTHQRPKVERYDDHLFVILRMPTAAVRGGVGGTADPLDAAALDAVGSTAGVATEQVAICLGADHVVTFQERVGDVFDPVRARLARPDGGIRRRGAAYLAYALVDAIVDAYFPVLEAFGERLEQLEADVLERSSAVHARRVHDLKRDLLALRRAVWPMRDALAALLRDDSPLVDDHTRTYLRDCLDHAAQLIDVIETYREIASGLLDLHLASVSNRMNEVMKVLTIIATIFIPLTFVAGIYGMNFDPDASPWNMPELAWRYGYPAVLVLMLVVAIALVAYFRRAGWIGGDERR